MPIFVVLLKGVNVGKAKRVSMACFKDCLLELGCKEATTLLNSGNAVIDYPQTSPAALAKKIAAALEDRFGFEVPAIVKSGTEFNRIVAQNTLSVPEEEHPRLLVAFSQNKASIAALGTLPKDVGQPEQFHITDQAAYLHCAKGILESRAAKALLGSIGKSVTTRNWATVLKLHALTAGSDA
jgi:uncharacterized protein (DUF1697 family)